MAKPKFEKSVYDDTMINSVWDRIMEQQKVEDKAYEEKREKKFAESVELMQDELDDWDNIQHARNQAMWMHNQRLLGELKRAGSNPPWDRQWDEPFIRIAKEIYRKSVTKDLVQWEIMHWPEDEVNGEPIKARTRKINVGLDDGESATDTVIDDLSTRLALEMDREIFKDLRLNVRTKATCGPYEKETPLERIWTVMASLSSVIYKKSLCGDGKWMVAGPRVIKEMCKMVGMQQKRETEDAIEHVGTICAHDAYCDPKFPEDQILMGVRFRDRYKYCPYILSKSVNTIGASVYTPGIFHRYSKKLPRQGPKAYGLIKLENFWDD